MPKRDFRGRDGTLRGKRIKHLGPAMTKECSTRYETTGKKLHSWRSSLIQMGESDLS